MDENGFTTIAPLLKAQHRQLDGLLDAVFATSGYQRQSAFTDFRRFLAAHEAAEEEAVHPAARTGAGGVVEQRLAEEYQAEQQITALEQLDVDSAAFTEQFGQLTAAVTAHARHEEHEEFPALTGVVDRITLIRLQQIVSQVPAMATMAVDQPFADQLRGHRQRLGGTADATTP